MNLTVAEQAFMDRSPHSVLKYENEKIPIIEVKNIYELGKIVSQRFIEWVRVNPNGVVALPTGKTPEFFIKTLEKYKKNWNEPSVQEELKQSGITGTFPSTEGLHFVMLDEFFPMASTHRNSFCRYIRTFYVDLLGIKHENMLTFDVVQEGALSAEDLNVFDGVDVDLTLLHREPTNATENIQKDVLLKAAKYCQVYEDKVKALGGIGFFLGGIGPDGHVAFNQEGHPLDSVTRLVNFNYPSAAQAASDLGGIKNARGKAAFTIGMATISAKDDAVVIIMAAGEGKATVVKAAVEGSMHPDRPASALQGHKGAKFYLTEGASSQLTARKAHRLNNADPAVCLSFALGHFAGLDCPGGADPAFSGRPPTDYVLVETFLYELSLKRATAVHLLKVTDIAADQEESRFRYPAFLSDASSLAVLVACAARRLRDKVAAGLRACSPKYLNILHTAPHHDDIMLSYHGTMHEMLGRRPVVHDLQATSDINANSGHANVTVSTASAGTGAAGASASAGASGDVMAVNAAPASPDAAAARTRDRGFSVDISTQLGEKHGGNINFFAYLTSGFHSVDDKFIGNLCRKVLAVDARSTDAQAKEPVTVLKSIVHDGLLTTDYDTIMSHFRRAFVARDEAHMDFVELIIFLRKVAEVWNVPSTLAYRLLDVAVTERVEWILNDFLANHSPGDGIPK